jgi:nucleoside-diphosphate-sugar epimerase
VLRLPDFYGPGVDKSFLHSAFTAAISGAKADMVAPLDVPHQFVYVPDVGPVVAQLAATPGAYGRVWHFAGSGTTTQAAILKEVEKQTGRPLRMRAAGKTLLRLLGLFNPMLREMVEMHYLLTEPVLMDDRALERLLGRLQRTSYALGVKETLAAARAIA